MNIKTTEPLISHGLGGHKTRSRIDKVPDGQVPEGAEVTDESPRDWRVDEPTTEN